ncbi:MAG: gliding motility-associated C-terminal domain-containing protein [Flavobacteriales bacterium]|nr:gliding motility-associated C-terminal domain-containing protein [Flavobacteriales bacterium]
MVKFSHIVTCALLLGSTLLSEAQTLYWVGGSGNWHDTAHWSETPGGAGGANLPDATTKVIFNDLSFDSEGLVSIAQNVTCGGLTVSSPQQVLFQSQTDEAFEVHGNFELSDLGLWDVSGTLTIVAEEPASLNTGKNVLPGDVVITGGGSIQLSGHLMTSASVSIGSNPLIQNGFALITHDFSFEPTSSTFWNLNGSTFYFDGDLTVSSGVHVSQDYAHAFMVTLDEEQSIESGELELTSSEYRTATCGTGPGQTPFTIDAVVISNYNGEDISCNGAGDGEAFVNVSGGVGPFTFQWIGGAPAFTQNYPNLEAGTYTVLVNDLGQGITCVDNVQLAEPAQMTVFSFNSTPPTCEGLCNGTGFPIVIGGIPGYDFLWSTGETTQTAVALCEGGNTLSVTDQNGCQFDSTFVLTVDPIVPNLDVIHIVCNGTLTGEASANPTGGDGGPYDFLWSTGDTGNSISGQPAGNYSLTVTDGTGCSVDVDFTINEEPPIQITQDDIQHVSCGGLDDGSISVSITGGTEPYTLTWTGPGGFTSSSEDISGLFAGDYELEVIDLNGCSQTVSYEVEEPPLLVVDPTVTPVSCFGGNDGSIVLNPSGGAPGYAVVWTGPNGFNDGTEDINGLEAGDYHFILTDNNGCTLEGDITVDEPEEIVADITLTPVTCNGANDAAIDLEISGGTAPYDVLWTGPGGFNSTNEDISNLVPGDYDLTITDANDCVLASTITIDPTPPIDVQFDIVEISCFGESDGAIDITITGGTPPYLTDWTGPNGFVSTNEDITALEQGQYDLLVTDDNGCSVNYEVVMNEPLEISILSVVTDVSCGGDSDGEIALSVLGGSPDYTFDWIGPNGFTSTDEDLTGLEAGTYTVTVTDAFGCTQAADIEVDEPQELELAADFTPITCNGAGDGSIDLTITGGQPPYNITWTGPGVVPGAEDQSNLGPGIYDVSVVDLNGCTAEAQIELTEPEALDIQVDTVDPTCFGQNDGSIAITISGGVEPYDILWDNGATDASLSDLPAGTYNVTITDATGCSQDINNIVLNEPQELVLQANGTDMQCGGNLNGSIDLTISGGTPDYVISWTGPNGFTSSDEDLANLEAGTYDVVVTDAAGCTAQASVEILEPEVLDVTGTTTPIDCFGDFGAIDLTITGGTAPIDVLWTGPDAFTSTDEDITNLEEGTYDVVVSDANGCTAELSFQIDAPTAIQVDAAVVDLDCSGLDNGSIEILISGGTPNYTILWIGPDGFTSDQDLIQNLAEGDYQLTVGDANGCTLDQTYSISQPELLEVTANVQHTLCFNENTGSIDVFISGGVPFYEVFWTGPNGFTSASEDIANLAPGTYDITVNDQGGCLFETTYEIENTSGLNIQADITNLSCSGLMDGAIDLTVTGGTPGYGITWDGPGTFTSTDEDLVDLQPGTYEVIVIDANLCEETEEFTIEQGALLEITLDEVINSTCGDTNGGATVSVTGGQEPVTIVWFDDAFNVIINGPTITDLAPGTYYAGAEDAAGCQEILEVNISDADVADVAATLTPPLCFGNTNGTIELEISNGNGPFDVSWVGSDGYTSTDEDIADLAGGTYTVTITDVNGCAINESYNLDEPELLELEADATHIPCNGEDSGAIDLTVYGGTPDYQFNWSGPGLTSFNEDITDLAQGDYTVFVTDANLCSTSLTVLIEESDELLLTVNAPEMLCFGDESGNIDITIGGGQQPFDFLWVGPDAFTSTNEDLTNIGAGDYTITVTDDAGCAVDSTITIAANPELIVDIDVVQPNCLQANGSATALASGGNAAGGYNYFWYDLDNGNVLIGTDSLVTDLPAGSYYLEVFDDQGCSYTTNVNLSDIEGTIDGTTQDPLCYGMSNGTINITVSGGNEPYTYEWNGPALFSSTDEDLTDLAAGVYTVQATDALGCIFSEDFEVTQPDSITIVFTSGNVGCAGDTTGAVLTSISGGTPQYVYDWTGPNGFTSNAQSLQDLGAGCYDLLITDVNLCTAQGQICIEEPNPIDMIADITHVLCAGDSTGVIDITVQGGASFFTYVWVGPNGFTSGDEDLMNIFAGTYDLLITDQAGCSMDTSFTVSEYPAMALDTLIILPSCPGYNDGSIELFPSGGQGAISVEWTGTVVSDQTAIVNLLAGTYDFMLTDEVGCTLTGSIELSDPDSLVVDAQVVPVTCFDEGDGIIMIDITGGTGPYSTFWQGPNGFSTTAEDLVDLAPGTYELTVGDAMACSATFTYQIDEPEPMDLNLVSLINESCPNSTDASIDIDVIGGWNPFNFEWTGPDGFTADTEDIDGLDSGTYSVTVTDSLGCSQEISSIPVIVLTEVIATAAEDILGCAGDGPWLATGSNTGGVEEQWADLDGNVLSTDSFLELDPEPGVYQYIYIAMDGICMDSDTIQITILENPLADAGEDMDVYYQEVIVLGGEPSALAENELWWSPAELLEDSSAFNPTTLEMIANTQFILTVVDENGCVGLDTVLINVIPEIDIPSGFSPNGDLINDAWAIGYIDFYKHATVEVYNRWGDLLFHSEGYGTPWDGTYNGSPLPIGTYYYVIEINEPQFPEPITGPVTILR